MRPLGDRVLIKEIEQITESKTASGIIIPTAAKEKEYDVVAIGPKCTIEVGAKIRLHEHTDKQLIDDDTYLIHEGRDIKVVL